MVSKLPRLAILALSGTEDRLYTVAVLTMAAASAGMETDVLLACWALLAAQKGDAYPVSLDYSGEGEALLEEAKGALYDALGTSTLPDWTELLRQARATGLAHVRAASVLLTMLGVDANELDPLIEGTTDFGAFVEAARDGYLITI